MWQTPLHITLCSASALTTKKTTDPTPCRLTSATPSALTTEKTTDPHCSTPATPSASALTTDKSTDPTPCHSTSATRVLAVVIQQRNALC